MTTKIQQALYFEVNGNKGLTGTVFQRQSQSQSHGAETSTKRMVLLQAFVVALHAIWWPNEYVQMQPQYVTSV